uniref:Repressor protein CI n=1 Tax=Dulem virus 39 TaxID=3145757 RepID=A0AAU8B8J7_9CAUD
MNKEKRKQSFLKLDGLVNARNITLYKVAGDLGFARSLFSDWKSGKSMPKTDKLIKIADYFGVEVNYFVD